MKILRKIAFLAGLFLLGGNWAVSAQEQKPVTLNGYVKDAASGEVLINATLRMADPARAAAPAVTTQTNAYGYFSLSLPAGSYELTVSHIGYQPYRNSLDLNASRTLELSLRLEETALETVVVTGEKRLRRTNTVALGIQQLSVSQIRKIPAFMGEPDVVKALLTLPGITSVGEGAAGFNVRGGNVDENLIIMDEAPVFNASHLLGFFSVFNPDAVKNVTLYKTAFPAEYGGRTSSVLDIRMKEGNNQKLAVNGGIGNIFSRLSVEGPLQKDRSSFIVAGRRSYIDVLSRPFMKKEDRDNTMYFYDLTAKANYRLNGNNTLYLSGYFGRDVFGVGNESRFKWGNTTGTLRWNHLFSPKLFLNTSVYYSKYDYYLGFQSDDPEKQESFDWDSDIQTYGVKPTLTWFLDSRHQLKTGINYMAYDFFPGKGVAVSDGVKNDITLKRRYGSELGIFAEDNWKISKRWNLQAGLRFNHYAYLGKTTVYHFRDTTANVRKPLDRQEEVASKKPVSTWSFLEPRLSMRFEVKKNTFLKAGIARSTQYLHLLSNTASPTPVDLYFPSTNNIRPSVTDQVSVGFVTIPQLLPLEFSAEVFYKRMADVLDYIDDAKLELNPLVEADLVTGKGRSWGLELEVKKEYGKWQGWVNYTFSRSERKTPGISLDQWYRSRADRPHVLNISAVRTLSDRLELSGTFSLASGTPATFPDIRLDIQDMPIPYNSTWKRNAYRLPAYHRLDLAATFKGNPKRKVKQEWVLGIYNVYARQNAYTIYFRQQEDNPQRTEAVRLSILGSIIPSITWNFKF